MNSALAIILATLVLVVIIGMTGRRGVRSSLEQWSIGGRSFSGLLVFVLTAGELYTTFTFLGASGFAYGHGTAALYIVVYTCLAFVMSYWLLPPIWRFAKAQGALTQADFFAKAYDSPALGLVVAATALVALIPYLILQFKGLGILVELTSYGRISTSVAVWVGAAAMSVYVTISGMHGSAKTAILKDALVLAVIVFLGIYLPIRYYGGVGEMFVRIEQARPDLLALPAVGFSPSWFISTVVLSSLGMYLWPHAFSVIFTAKAERSFRKNAIVMPLYALVMLFSMLAGFAAVLQVPGLVGGKIDLALLKLSIQTFDPWFVGVIGAAGLLTALVPGSIMLISATTLVTRNLYLPARPASTDAHLSLVSRVATVLITLSAVLLTLGGARSIVSLLIVGFSFVTQLAPALFAAVSRSGIVNKFGAITGILTGVAFVALTTWTGITTKTLLPTAPSWLQDVNIGVVGLVLNAVMLFAASALTRRSSHSSNSIFTKSGA